MLLALFSSVRVGIALFFGVLKRGDGSCTGKTACSGKINPSFLAKNQWQRERFLLAGSRRRPERPVERPAVHGPNGRHYTPTARGDQDPPRGGLERDGGPEQADLSQLRSSAVRYRLPLVTRSLC